MAIRRSNWTLWTGSSTPTKNYTVIWWFMEPDGTIVEERQYQYTPVNVTQDDFNKAYRDAANLYNTDATFRQVVNSNRTNTNWWANGVWGNYNPILDWSRGAATITPLSTSDVLWARYQAAVNSGNSNLADAYKALNKENTAYNRVANQIADYYGALAQDVAKREQWLADAKYAVANKLFDDMASQKDYVWWLYWPEGSLTTAINKYYDDMWDYLASEAGREMAYADALWVQSWASLWMMRAQRNQAYNEAFQKSIQVMQAELEAKQSIAQNLITFMTNLRQEYWNTANTYIISQYQRANDLLNAISESIAQSSSNIAAAKLSVGKGSSSSDDEEDSSVFPSKWTTQQKLTWLKNKWYYYWYWLDKDKDWNIVTYSKDGKSEVLISADDLTKAGTSAQQVFDTVLTKPESTWTGNAQ